MLFLSAYSVSGYALIFYDIGNTISYIIKAYGWMRIAAYFKSIALRPPRVQECAKRTLSTNKPKGGRR